MERQQHQTAPPDKDFDGIPLEEVPSMDAEMCDIGQSEPESAAQKQPKLSNKPFRSVKAEVAVRAVLYRDDWAQATQQKALVASATWFIYFVSLAPAITFASFLLDGVGGNMGVIEVLFSMALCGVIYSLFSGQPLVIVGVTGPITILTITIFQITSLLDLDFLPFMCWISFWSSLLHVLLAALNLCRAVKFVTKFTCEIFGILIALVYIVTGIKELVHTFHVYEMDIGLFALLLALGTLFTGLTLGSAKNWNIFTSPIRRILSEYNVPISVLVFTAISATPYFLNSPLPRLPTSDFLPSNGRTSWLVPFWETPAWAVFLAIGPAIVLTTLIFFDHNVSSLLAQLPQNGLKKAPAFNYDLLVIGVLMIPCGLLGLPWAHGLIPQAPLHVQSLTVTAAKRPHVCETRLSALCQSFLTGLTLIPPILKLLSFIPKSVLSGLFFFMAVESFHGNTFAARMKLLVSEGPEASREGNPEPTDTNMVDKKTQSMRKFTLIQLLCLAVVFVITEVNQLTSVEFPLSITFPVLILMLVPLRHKVFPNFFSREALDALDRPEFENVI